MSTSCVAELITAVIFLDVKSAQVKETTTKLRVEHGMSIFKEKKVLMQNSKKQTGYTKTGETSTIQAKISLFCVLCTTLINRHRFLQRKKLQGLKANIIKIFFVAAIFNVLLLSIINCNKSNTIQQIQS